MKKISLKCITSFMIGIAVDMFIFFLLKTKFEPFVLDWILIIGPLLFAGGLGMTEFITEQSEERDYRREGLLYLEIFLCVILTEIVLYFTGLLTSIWILFFHGIFVAYISAKLLKPRYLSSYEPGIALLYSLLIIFAMSFYSALLLKGVVILVLLLVLSVVYLFQTA